MAEKSSLDEALERIVGTMPTTPAASTPAPAPSFASTTPGTTVALGGAPPAPVVSPFESDLAAIQAQTDQIRAQTTALQSPAAFSSAPVASTSASAPAYDSSRANQAARTAYDSTMAAWQPMISPEEFDRRSIAYQQAMWDKALATPGQTYGIPGRPGSGPVVDIFTPPPSELQAQAAKAARRTFGQEMGVTSRAQLGAMAPEERQTLKGQYQAPETPVSPYWGQW